MWSTTSRQCAKRWSARLRFEGYTAELAEDGMAGLAAHAERPADAIVLDIAMPRLDGLEMCRRCEQQATAPRS